MTFHIEEWLNLALRWLHFTTGIAWIGSSFYFIWLDNHLTPPKVGGASGELWSVHGVGFYHKQKYQVAPAQMPAELHWFKWEAYFTWISGFSLLVLIYYIQAEIYLLNPAKSTLEPWQAIALGLAALGGGWLFYDRLCRSALGRNNRLLGAVWYGALVAAAYALNSAFSSRGAYLHVGAMIGSAMVGNVFFVIIPNQRKVVAALVAGREPNPALGKAAKQRSLHNNYMTLPVLFIMISHHYPMTYGAERPWLVLALIGATGVAVRHVFNLRHRGAALGPTIALAVALALASVTYVATGASAACRGSAGRGQCCDRHAGIDRWPSSLGHTGRELGEGSADLCPPLYGLSQPPADQSRLRGATAWRRARQLRPRRRAQPPYPGGGRQFRGHATRQRHWHDAGGARENRRLAFCGRPAATLSTHVLDLAAGRPAATMNVTLEHGAATLFKGTTDNDGRYPGIAELVSAPAVYRLRFGVAAYFRGAGLKLPEPPFLDEVVIEFGGADPGAHYHVPLLVTPFAYSTYRGS